jgi:hypothetical protein
MSVTLEAHGVENLDVAIVRSANRLLTREIALWAYAATDEDGIFTYSGIRYASRLGDYECWAIFLGTEVDAEEARAIEKTDASLERVGRAFGLTIH